ncbi:MAG: 7-cyano-7-deazaguanine synthase QueC [Candidatus Omnitrophica bacterium]|nr:7-cyano-7-deazaguanine synthase QueC [Candidatus Omnitrophota bacterium]
MKNKAIVLLSGGLDSATALYIAKAKGYNCHCLIFDYGQRHRKEIGSAKRIACSAKCPYQIIKISLPWKGSSLLDKSIRVKGQGLKVKGIPSTYVPGRNIIFLSFALSYAEAIGAKSIFIGAHAQDYSGYPDCRPDFFAAFKNVISRGTKAGVEGRPIKIEAPLINMNKSGIIKAGNKLRVPFALTWSCYRGGREPCEKCDSCYYRAKGFKEAGVKDALIK